MPPVFALATSCSCASLELGSVLADGTAAEEVRGVGVAAGLLAASVADASVASPKHKTATAIRKEKHLKDMVSCRICAQGRSIMMLLYVSEPAMGGANFRLFRVVTNVVTC